MKTLVTALLMFWIGLASAAPTNITVYKSPTCGCCGKWIEHLEANGFKVKAVNQADVSPIKQQHGVPYALGSCHTALVDGYVIEGHVPADDIKRLLRERPKAVGLAVPGMPTGSPGMEGPNPERYETLLFEKDGKSRPYAQHGPRF